MLGFININKPKDMTSSSVVVKIRKKFGIKKVGHMGTLDPLASGVLPIAVGKATRMFDYFQDKFKSYRATFRFGILTDTLDITGKIVETNDIIPTKEELESVLESFVGQMPQIPPIFSAKVVNGVKSYKLARAGINPELQPKIIEIARIDLLSFIDREFVIDVTCSSGTYIRALGRDIAKKLGTICSMTDLVRTESGVFKLSNSYNLEEILSCEEVTKFITPVEDVFPKIKTIEVNEDSFAKLKNGLSIDDKWNLGKLVYIKHDGEILGVAENKDKILKLKTYLME